jgi:uncharacterized iron-regulated membrane protein
MQKTLQKIHRWVGLPLGLLFIVTFGTGFITAIEELISRTQQYSEFQYTTSTTNEISSALEIITKKGTKNIQRITLPSKETPYFQVYMKKNKLIYPIKNLEKFIIEKKQEDGFFKTVLNLHRNLLLGKEGFLGIKGSHYVAWISLFALFISSLGLWLWWPLRKTFNVKNIVPTSTKRKSFFFSHMTSGVVTLILIVLMSLTGASITYREIAKQLLGVETTNIQKSIQHNQKNTAHPTQTLEKSWSSWIQASEKLMPQGTLQFINFPRRKSELITLQYLKPGDWLGLANNKVKVHQKKSIVVETVNFQNFSFGQKLYSILKPLHTGRDLHFSYVVLLLIMSLIGTVMVVSGVVSFTLKHLPKKYTKKVFLKRA